MTVVIGILTAGPAVARAEEPPVSRQDITLSPDLRELLLAEMREIAGGIQSVASSLAAGDWKSIVDTSARIRASYIMEKRLTASQAEELERVLPQDFKRLDGEFHLRAEQLGSAAAARDPELVAFQYSRLLENCAACHAAYAKSRFPAFSPPQADTHQP